MVRTIAKTHTFFDMHNKMSDQSDLNAECFLDAHLKWHIIILITHPILSFPKNCSSFAHKIILLAIVIEENN